jgi:hypothetical protein
MRIWVQLFRSMRIRIRIQGFDDQKWQKIKRGIKKNVIYIFLGLHKGRPSHCTADAFSPHYREHQELKKLKFLPLFQFIALLDPDPDPADQNQCGSRSETLLSYLCVAVE